LFPAAVAFPAAAVDDVGHCPAQHHHFPAVPANFILYFRNKVFLNFLFSVSLSCLFF
jgi:hypothetical protein